mmetsp:Transcript_26981/g.44938  ORF Transcript_26981/g.44938 Transcript_26981/m.44938 type:complete len:167 (+) Transcript_26981:29-529(+)
MVRHKTRWLLVRLEFESDIQSSSSTSPALSRRVVASEDDESINKSKLLTKDIYKELVKTLSVCFGLSAHAIIHSIVVRHIDDATRLTMIRVPRSTANQVRTAVTYMTTLNEKNIVASVISVNGSARTARLSAMHEIRKRVPKTNPLSPKELKQLDARLQVIREIDS